jgi:hypothetical protein
MTKRLPLVLLHGSANGSYSWGAVREGPRMSRWRFEVTDGVGHEFANEYFPMLREWAGGVGAE